MAKVNQEVYELEKDLYKIHNDILGYVINHREQSYWTNLISSGNKTLEDYKMNLLTSENYLSSIQIEFKSLFYSIIGYDAIFDEETMSNFQLYVQEYLNINCKEMTPLDIKKYITTLDTFKNTYRARIETQISNLDKEKYDFIINKFINDFNFDTDKLDVCLIDMIKNNTLENLAIQSDVIFNERVNQVESNISIISNISKPELDNNILKSFSSIFKRQMFVEEYFFYVLQNINYDYNEYISYKNLVQSLYKQYVDSDIDEYQFTLEYISHKDKSILESIEKNTLDALIISDIYYTKMKNNLREKYKLLYTSEIENNDLEYFFFKAKEELLFINDTRIEEMIIVWKSQTDNYIYEIYETYLKLLDRKPDVHEINDILNKYRYTTINTLDYMERNIINSLEFNDVMKKLICEKYKDNTDIDILPSILYNIIKDLRENHINDNTSYTEIQKLIDINILNIL